MKEQKISILFFLVFCAFSLKAYENHYYFSNKSHRDVVIEWKDDGPKRQKHRLKIPKNTSALIGLIWSDEKKISVYDNESFVKIFRYFNASQSPVVFDISQMQGTGQLLTLNDLWQVSREDYQDHHIDALQKMQKDCSTTGVDAAKILYQAFPDAMDKMSGGNSNLFPQYFLNQTKEIDPTQTKQEKIIDLEYSRQLLELDWSSPQYKNFEMEIKSILEIINGAKEALFKIYSKIEDKGTNQASSTWSNWNPLASSTQYDCSELYDFNSDYYNEWTRKLEKIISDYERHCVKIRAKKFGIK